MDTTQTENRGILTRTRASELKDEAWNAFSDAPFDFETSVLDLWGDTQKSYYHACTANRFSEEYLKLSTVLEKNIRQLGSYCLTKTVLEQKGYACTKLSDLTINELVRMVSFHLRKSHAAFEGIYKDNNILGVTYLNWEFRWFDLGNRLKATEVKIRDIKDGKINVDSMLKEAETFKGQERTNTNPETPKSLRPNPNALPVQGSMARVLLQVERDEEMQAEQIRKERERKLKEAERLERRADRVLGGFSPAKPFGPDKKDLAQIDRIHAQRLRDEAEELSCQGPEPEEEQSSEEGIPEEEARRILLEDAVKRNDQEAIKAIPLEETPELHSRWKKYVARVEREALHSSAGPSDKTRKALREKRKKKKR
ncbi:MAG: hypothetical protein IJI41_03280 [Anaerolineaceae bacterium]|nr:hypothetical protein [Anaerolineaceae bacterium]